MHYKLLTPLLAMLLSVFLVGCISAVSPTQHPEDPCSSIPQGKISFPKDEFPHSEPIEWYYWTGHLKTEEERWFGYELVFFVLDLRGQEGLMSNSAIKGMVEKLGGKVLVFNHAITDIDAGNFHYTGGFALRTASQSDKPLRFEINGSSTLLDSGNDTLHGEVDDYVIDLNLDSVKAPVLQHGDGYHEYSFGGYTYYYSRERINTTGTITIDGVAHAVEGTSWFDHQWGQMGSVIDVGWDWFSIQLEDNREIMLFTVNADNQMVLVGGSLASSDCLVTEIAPKDMEITVLGTWNSPHTNKTYPSGWRIWVDDIDMTVTPVMEDQELGSSYMTYWEGACEVSGDVIGRAYVELTGY